MRWACWHLTKKTEKQLDPGLGSGILAPQRDANQKNEGQKMKTTKRISAIRFWPEDRKRKVFNELMQTINLPLNLTTVRCSAFACQVSEAGAQFKKGLGEKEFRFILWG